MGGNAVRATELARVLAGARRRHCWPRRASRPRPGPRSATPAGTPGTPRGCARCWPARGSSWRRRRARWCRRSCAAAGRAWWPTSTTRSRSRSSRGSATRRRWRRRLDTTLTLDTFVAALSDAHHAICASERQRDLWLGLLLGAGLLGPATYDADPSLRSRLDVVPVGVSSAPLPASGGHLRARLPQLADDDEVVLWYGGLWSWMDPATAVRAMAELLPRRPRARLVVLGRAPSAARERRAADAARRVAGELGLAGEQVLFVDDVVPYAERGGWLRDADVAISTHLDHLETRFAFRTRILDFVWAGLPSVCTEGDDLSALVAQRGLGVAVPPGDASAAADALDGLLAQGRDAAAERFAAVAAELAWPRGRPAARALRHRGPAAAAPGRRRAAGPARRAGAVARRPGAAGRAAPAAALRRRPHSMTRARSAAEARPPPLDRAALAQRGRERARHLAPRPQVLASRARGDVPRQPRELEPEDPRRPAQRQRGGQVLDRDEDLVADDLRREGARPPGRRGRADVEGDGRRLVPGRPAAQPGAEAPVDVLVVGLQVDVVGPDVVEGRAAEERRGPRGGEDLRRRVEAAVVRLALPAAVRVAVAAQEVAGPVEVAAAVELRASCPRRRPRPAAPRAPPASRSSQCGSSSRSLLRTATYGVSALATARAIVAVMPRFSSAPSHRTPGHSRST